MIKSHLATVDFFQHVVNVVDNNLSSMRGLKDTDHDFFQYIVLLAFRMNIDQLVYSLENRMILKNP